MWKSLASGCAIVAASALMPASGGAMPLNQAISADAGDVTLVRDGCGRGLRFSNRRQACVPIDYGPGYGYVDPGEAAAAAAAATALGVLGVVTAPGPGYGGKYRGPRGNQGVNRQNFQNGNRQNFNGNRQVIQNGNRGNAGFSGAPNSWKKPGTGIQ
jgi:hypothetical protein